MTRFKQEREKIDCVICEISNVECAYVYDATWNEIEGESYTLSHVNEWNEEEEEIKKMLHKSFKESF